MSISNIAKIFQPHSGQYQIVEIPTYVMKSPDKQTLHAQKVKLSEMGSYRIGDGALKLSGNKQFQADFATGEILSGIVELDLYAEQNDEISLKISDHEGDIIQQLNIRSDGSFYSGSRKLRDSIRWMRRRYDAPLKFVPGRWHTFRLRFDNQTGLNEIALRDSGRLRSFFQPSKFSDEKGQEWTRIDKNGLDFPWAGWTYFGKRRHYQMRF